MSLRRDGHFAAGGQERKRVYTPATIAIKPAGNQAILNFPLQSREVVLEWAQVGVEGSLGDDAPRNRKAASAI
jgi:hypothetical protein